MSSSENVASRARRAVPKQAKAADRPEPTYEQEVAELAYQFYQERGCLDGFALDDWLLAEAELAEKHAVDQAEEAIRRKK
jgi:hypothetical protein